MADEEHLRILKEGVWAWNAFILKQRDDFVADLNSANLDGADLNGAYLRHADLRRANLNGANLNGAYLNGAKLRRADLNGVDLRHAKLRRAYLRDANLRNAYLRDADLRNADLNGADLRRADMSDANLSDANLSKANLGDAVLRRAVIKSVKVSLGSNQSAKEIFTDLRFARNLTQEQLNQMLGDSGTLIPDHLERPVHWPKFEKESAASHSTAQESSPQLPHNPRIFLSHSLEETALCTVLAQQLTDYGLDVSWSDDSTSSEQIQAYSHVFVLWTDISVKNTTVQNQAQLAKDRNIYFGLQIGNAEVPSAFQGDHVEKLEGWANIQEIAETILALVAQSSGYIEAYGKILDRQGRYEPDVQATEDGHLEWTESQSRDLKDQGLLTALEGLRDLRELIRKSPLGNLPSNSFDLLDRLIENRDATEVTLWDSIHRFLTLHNSENTEPNETTELVTDLGQQILLGLEADFKHIADRAAKRGTYSPEKLQPADVDSMKESLKGIRDRAKNELKEQVELGIEALEAFPNQKRSKIETQTLEIQLGINTRLTWKSCKALTGKRPKDGLIKTLRKTISRLAGRFMGVR